MSTNQFSKGKSLDLSQVPISGVTILTVARTGAHKQVQWLQHTITSPGLKCLQSSLIHQPRAPSRRALGKDLSSTAHQHLFHLLPISSSSLATLGLLQARNTGFAWLQSHPRFIFRKQNPKAWLCISLLSDNLVEVITTCVLVPNWERKTVWQKMPDWGMGVRRICIYYIEIIAYYIIKHSLPLTSQSPISTACQGLFPGWQRHGMCFSGHSGYKLGCTRSTISFIFLYKEN